MHCACRISSSPRHDMTAALSKHDKHVTRQVACRSSKPPPPLQYNMLNDQRQTGTAPIKRQATSSSVSVRLRPVACGTTPLRRSALQCQQVSKQPNAARLDNR